MGSNGVGWGQMGSKPGGGGGGGLIVGVAIDWKRLNHEGYKEKEVKTEGKWSIEGNWKYSGEQLSHARVPADPQIL